MTEPIHAATQHFRTPTKPIFNFHFRSFNFALCCALICPGRRAPSLFLAGDCCTLRSLCVRERKKNARTGCHFISSDASNCLRLCGKPKMPFVDGDAENRNEDGKTKAGYYSEMAMNDANTDRSLFVRRIFYCSHRVFTICGKQFLASEFSSVFCVCIIFASLVSGCVCVYHSLNLIYHGCHLLFDYVCGP